MISVIIIGIPRQMSSVEYIGTIIGIMIFFSCALNSVSMLIIDHRLVSSGVSLMSVN